MKTKIFYMSGTGNSLYVARRIGEALGDSELINIASLNKKNVNIVNSDRIGIVYPSYCQDIPRPLRKFLNSLQFKSKPEYIFSVCTHNGFPGDSIKSIDKIMKKNNLKLNFGVDMLMPGNSVIVMDYTSKPDEQERRHNLSEQTLIEFIRNIEDKTEKINTYKRTLKEIIRGKVSDIALFNIYNLPKRFNASDNCTGCGLCERVCSFDNINLVDNKPSWNKNCESCLACFHYCPTKAINIDSYTSESIRYHHPKINIDVLENPNKVI